MPTYQIKNWNTHFENFKSRERDECSFVCVPNKQHGFGLMTILSEPDGLAIYGAWNLFLGLCSRQRRPREGWLTKDGRPDGKPLTPADLSKLFRRPTSEVQRALDFISSEEVGWIEGYDSIREVPAEYLEGKKEGRNRKKEGKKEECSEPASGQSLPPPGGEHEVAIAYPVFPAAKGRKKGPTTWVLTDAHVQELAKTFPAVDVPAESREAWQWIKSNPAKVKTASGMSDFLRRWMSKEQDKGGTRQRRPSVGDYDPTSDFTHPDYRSPPLTREQREAMKP